MGVDIDLPLWSPPLQIVAYSFHGVAIACTLFRLAYRWFMARFWWEDVWAAFALVSDIACVVAACLEAPSTAQGMTPRINDATRWMVGLGFICVLWACRISILLSIVRVTNPSPQHRRITYLIGCSFLVMWVALIIQRIVICVKYSCEDADSVALSQLITDVISDSALVVLPIFLLRQTKLSSRQRTVVYLVFFPSLSISAVTIFHSSILFTEPTSGTIVIAHVKTALALMVCNLLVIVAFVSRVCSRGQEHNLEEARKTLTSIELDTGVVTETTVNYKCTGSITPMTTISMTTVRTATTDTEPSMVAPSNEALSED